MHGGTLQGGSKICLFELIKRKVKTQTKCFPKQQQQKRNIEGTGVLFKGVLVKEGRIVQLKPLRAY